jgi:DNA polymerase-3 subunit delta
VIITLTGKNGFLLQRRLKQLTDEFLKQESELALEKIDGSEVEFEALSDAVASVPFLASAKMVVVRQLSANKAAAEKIEQIISTVAPTTELIIVEANPDKRTTYFKVLKEQTALEEFEELDVHQLAKWLVDETKKQGGSLTHAHANYLVERLGPNQMMLASELDKLLIYNSAITQDTIDLLTEKNPQSKIFDLLDATFAGNKQKALELYEEQRAQKVEPQAILALMAWQLQIIALAKLGEGKTAGQIAKDSKMSPYPITKAQPLARKLSREKLQQMIDEALEMDYKSKISGIDLNEALKTYITTL